MDHCWLNPDGGVQRMAAVTEGTSADMAGHQRVGTVLLFQSVEEAPYLEYRRTMTVLLRGSTRIETICASSRGFILGGNNGFFSVYEKTDDRKDPYMHIKTFYCGRETFSSICCNHNDEQVVAFSKNCRLLSFPLGSVDMIDESSAEESFLDIIPGGSHEGGIINTSVCAQKPILATVGSDRTVRIWNYVKWHCELSQDFHNDEPTCVALHPSGVQILVALRERVRLYNIMVDELRQYRELPLKGCRELSFCNGGHMFACCLGISISVYSTSEYNAQTGLQLICSFSGHMSAVKRVLWSPDDTFMYSCGMDGMVYGWDLYKNGARFDDVNLLNKPTSYTGMVAEFANKDPSEKVRSGKGISASLSPTPLPFLTSLISTCPSLFTTRFARCRRTSSTASPSAEPTTTSWRSAGRTARTPSSRPSTLERSSATASRASRSQSPRNTSSREPRAETSSPTTGPSTRRSPSTRCTGRTR